jgi:hypothetical protein
MGVQSLGVDFFENSLRLREKIRVSLLIDSCAEKVISRINNSISNIPKEKYKIDDVYCRVLSYGYLNDSHHLDLEIDSLYAYIRSSYEIKD